MEEEMKEQGKKIAKLIAKAWSDESFKERLLADSRAVFEDEGIKVPQGVDIKVVEQTDTQTFFVIPKKPVDIDISEWDERNAALSYAGPMLTFCLLC
jgi:hypothetical protein